MWVSGAQHLDALHLLGAEDLVRRRRVAQLQRAHRSTSPRTKSSDPRIATVSATRWPTVSRGLAALRLKPGARTLSPQGFCGASRSIYRTSPPRGASGAWAT